MDCGVVLYMSFDHCYPDEGSRFYSTKAPDPIPEEHAGAWMVQALPV